MAPVQKQKVKVGQGNYRAQLAVAREGEMPHIWPADRVDL